MNMIYTLPALGVRVHKQAESAFSYPFFFGNKTCYAEQMTDKGFIFIGNIQGGGNMLSGNDKNMHRRLRTNIFKYNGIGVFIDYFCRNRFRADLAEKTIVYGLPPFLPNLFANSFKISEWDRPSSVIKTMQ